MKKIRFLIMTVLLILVFAGCEQPAKPKKFDSSAQTEAVKKRKRTFMVVVENTTEADCRVNVEVSDKDDGNTSGWTTVSRGTYREITVTWTSRETYSNLLSINVDVQASGYKSASYSQTMTTGESGRHIYIGVYNNLPYYLKIWD
jgi:lipoprotein